MREQLMFPPESLYSDCLCITSQPEVSEVVDCCCPETETAVTSHKECCFSDQHQIFNKDTRSTIYHCSTKDKIIKKINSDFHGKNELTLLHEFKNHPFIVRLNDFSLCKHQITLIQEYLSYGDLEQFIQDYHHNKNIPERVIWKWLVNLTIAIKSLHLSGWVHRDIKPNNILVSDEGTLKLCDFGFSSRSYTQCCLAGTPAFAPPELQGNDTIVEPSMDIWMLGCTLYEIINKRPVFISNSWEGHFKEVSQFSFEKLYFNPFYSTHLKELVKQLLHPNPVYRPTSVELFRYLSIKNINFVENPLYRLPCSLVGHDELFLSDDYNTV